MAIYEMTIPGLGQSRVKVYEVDLRSVGESGVRVRVQGYALDAGGRTEKDAFLSLMREVQKRNTPADKENVSLG